MKSEMAFNIFLLYLLVINTVCYFLFFWDKRMATRGRRRIPERNLLMTGIFGGALGGIIAMHMFRHKTLHRKFKLGFPVILILHLSLLYLLLRY